MIAVGAPIGFPERHVPDKTFQIIAFLVDDVKFDGSGIRLKGFLSLDALCVRMDIVSIEKTHNVKSFTAKNLCRVYGARGATDV